MKKIIFKILLLFVVSNTFAQTHPLWMRYPSISPDGKKIAFGYKGDIYVVDATGGNAQPLTIHEAQDMLPVWSHDSKTIAFASDRYGNFDVYTVPAIGGTASRITFNSANDYPFDFSKDDKKIIFGSSRNVASNNIRFYSPRLLLEESLY